MKKTELLEKVYAAPEISVEDVAIEAGFAASTLDLENDDPIEW